VGKALLPVEQQGVPERRVLHYLDLVYAKKRRQPRPADSPHSGSMRKGREQLKMSGFYEFTLKFAVPVRTEHPDDWIERLAESGCDDALIGTGMPGRLALAFDRAAETAEEALRSALADVRRAIPEAQLIEAGPDFVGITEMADFLGISRQAMRKTVERHIDTFPLPVHEGNPSLWHLQDALEWLQQVQGRETDEALREVARSAYALNINRGREAA
jgi:predicted DNA-binding transcriptional regulator AlpA